MVNIVRIRHDVRVVHFRVSTSKAISLSVWVGTGGRYEQAQENGISHYLEHLVFKGTRHRGLQDIKEAIEGKGGALNGFTSEETTCFLAKTLRDHFAAALEILLDMTFFPALQLRDVERERGVIFEEIRMYMDLPQHQAYDRLMGLLWPHHPLGRNLAGSLSSVERLSADDLRHYQRRWYVPSNVTVVVCGDVSLRRTLAVTEAFFKKYRVPPECLPREHYAAAPSLPRAAAFEVSRASIQQIQLCLGMHAFPRGDPDRYALALLHIVLGANMSSRLFNEIREQRGYAYEISTAIKQFNDAGAFIIHAGLVRDKIEATLELIGRILRSVKNKGVGHGELLRAKEYFRGQFIMGLEDTGERMLWIGEQIMTRGRVESEQKILRHIAGLSSTDLRRAARRIFSASTSGVALVGAVPPSVQRRLSGRMKGWV